MQYITGGNNQPEGRILSKAMEDHATIHYHIGNNGNAATIQWNISVFENFTNRFYIDFMRDRYPNRNSNSY